MCLNAMRTCVVSVCIKMPNENLKITKDIGNSNH